MFKNMGGNIPGGNFPGGNFVGGNFPGGSFPDTASMIRCYLDTINLKAIWVLRNLFF